VARVGVLRVVTHPAAYAGVYSSRRIADNMFLRGLRVETKAKTLLSTSPRRVDSGRLRSSVNTRRIRHGISHGARVGTSVFYGIYVHRGTGIYGPFHTPILPRQATRLRFRPKGSSKYIFVTSVKGMRPNPFLVNALPAAKMG
jgi:hypothetical protein